MICVEVPLRTIRDQIDSIESAVAPGESAAFAAGAIAALGWVADPTSHESPAILLMKEWRAKQGAPN